jgi:hypothetical protein
MDMTGHVLIGPKPHYITGWCCESVAHLGNVHRDDYGKDILEAQEVPRPVLLGWALMRPSFTPRFRYSWLSPSLGTQELTVG